MKIQSTELRIGNFIDSNLHQEGSSEWGNYYKVDLILLEIFDRVETDGIDLDEEWLLKFGLIELYWSEDNSNLNRDIQVGYFNNDFINEEITLRYKKKVDFKIRYVHQLQNLYFALTGTELELKK